MASSVSLGGKKQHLKKSNHLKSTAGQCKEDKTWWLCDLSLLWSEVWLQFSVWAEGLKESEQHLREKVPWNKMVAQQNTCKWWWETTCSSSHVSVWSPQSCTALQLLMIYWQLQTPAYVQSYYCLTCRAAFDTISHPILINRLKQRAGITGTSLDWFSCEFN